MSSPSTENTSTASSFRHICSQSAEEYPAVVDRWLSDQGHPLLPIMPEFDPKKIDEKKTGLWRYAALLPFKGKPFAENVGGTELKETSIVGMPLHAKLEYENPFGSYKDRGVALMAASLIEAGIRTAIIDSSGNAGFSLASHLAGTGINVLLFVPENTPQYMVDRASAAGAQIDQAASSRSEAAIRAQTALEQDALGEGVVYASHVYSPFFLAGQMTMAWEIWEDLGRKMPQNVVVPVGNGLIVLGLYLGFKQIIDAGLAEDLPRIFGMQARVCAPIFDAFSRKSKQVAVVATRPSIATGLSVDRPPRGQQVLEAIRESDGWMISVSEEEILRGHALAHNMGYELAYSSASAIAGIVKLDKVIGSDQSVVMVLSGGA